MKLAVIAVTSPQNENGGAERFYQGLTAALRTAGTETDLIEVVSNESSFEAIKETYLRFYDLDVSSYDGIISTKAPSYMARHDNHVCYLVHTMRVFYDMFETEFRKPSSELLEQRKFIQALDTAALSSPRVKKIFTIGNEITGRLRDYNALESEVLHPALVSDSFRTGEYRDYLFMPGRLHRWKRIELVIKALRCTKSPVKLKIAGVGEDEKDLRKLAGNNPRIEFLGKISDQELVELYANALAVPFVPRREDYGYVTLEAFKSNKPVITCEDSGEPTHFVKNLVNGFVCRPAPEDIGRKIDFLYFHREQAREMGVNGNKTISHICWTNIANTLIDSLGRKDGQQQ